MMLSPMVGDVEAATKPHPFVALYIIEEASQGCRPPRTSDEATVQTDRHHFGSGFTLGIEDVEAIPQIGEELLAAIKPLVGGESHIVGVQRIRNDQVRHTVISHPIGQIVGIAIGVVEKSALLHEEFTGIGTAAASIPTQGMAAGPAL